ncbi:MAG: glycosyltransferase [Actinobacteria bacterium]|nr:glycosyltransferase [Actinomycetota bacterium]
MKAGILSWWRGRDPFDLLAGLFLLLCLVLILANLSMYPVYLDIPYHMAVTRAFREAGGVVTWDFWDSAPSGRPHIYPPFLHVGMSLLEDAGLSPETVATMVCVVMFPLVLISMWWAVRKLFGPRAAFYSLVLLAVPYAFFYQAGITIAASVVLALTPLVFLALEKDRKLAASLLLAMCLYAHLVLGHLAALALAVYMLHRRELWKRTAVILAAAHFLYLPWGVVVASNLGSFSVSEPGMGGGFALHILLWGLAAAGVVVCYLRRMQYYLLPAYLISMVPIAFFYSHRFWEGHVFLPLAMLGGVALDRVHGLLRERLSRGERASASAGMLAAATMALIAVAVFFVYPVLASEGGPRATGLPPGAAGYLGGGPAGGTGGMPGGGGNPDLREGAPPLPGGDYRAGGTGGVAGARQQRLLRLREPARGSTALRLQPTVLTVLLRLEEPVPAGLPGSREAFGKENMELMRAVEARSDPGDTVYVAEGRLGDLIYALTGRCVTQGMFHEVQPERRGDPWEVATLAVVNAGPQAVPPAGGGGAGAGAGGKTDAFPAREGWSAAERVGGYLLLVRDGEVEEGVSAAASALPLWAAYALVLAAVAAIVLDLFVVGNRWKWQDPSPHSPSDRPEGGAGGKGGSALAVVPARDEEGNVEREVGRKWQDPSPHSPSVRPEGGAGGKGGSALAVVPARDEEGNVEREVGRKWQDPSPHSPSDRPEGGAGGKGGSALAVVPARDEEGNVERVVREIRSTCPGMEILVVDDASRDGTGAGALAEGALVMRLPRNEGVGQAERHGLSFALEHGYSFAVRLDADGQHPARHIQDLLEPLVRGEADVVVGSRFMADTLPSYAPSFFRCAGISWLRALLRRRTGIPLTDPTSGFRAYSRQAMRLLASADTSRYPEVRSLLLLCGCGLRVRETAVEMRPRLSGSSSLGAVAGIRMLISATIDGLFFRVRPGSVRVEPQGTARAFTTRRRPVEPPGAPAHEPRPAAGDPLPGFLPD